jgi:hypothetical protein
VLLGSAFPSGFPGGQLFLRGHRRDRAGRLAGGRPEGLRPPS